MICCSDRDRDFDLDRDRDRDSDRDLDLDRDRDRDRDHDRDRDRDLDRDHDRDHAGFMAHGWMDCRRRCRKCKGRRPGHFSCHLDTESLALIGESPMYLSIYPYWRANRQRVQIADQGFMRVLFMSS
jgi:hypothetical protein